MDRTGPKVDKAGLKVDRAGPKVDRAGPKGLSNAWGDLCRWSNSRLC